MLFPTFQITEVKKQTQRDLTRFDLDFDLSDRFLPEFPSPIYLTTSLTWATSRGDSSSRQLHALFNGLLNQVGPFQGDDLPFRRH